MLHSAECEMLRCKCKWMQDFNFLQLLMGEGGKERVEKCCIVLSVKF